MECASRHAAETQLATAASQQLASKSGLFGAVGGARLAVPGPIRPSRCFAVGSRAPLLAALLQQRLGFRSKSLEKWCPYTGFSHPSSLASLASSPPCSATTICYLEA